MSFTVFLGNLPVWVTADDIKSWLAAEGLVSDAVKVIRNPETQESKGFAFIDAPNSEEMNSIIRRFDRAPLEDRLLRANPAQPPKSKVQRVVVPATSGVAPPPAAPQPHAQQPYSQASTSAQAQVQPDRNRRGGKKHKRGPQAPQSAFAEELAKAL
jgi:RNA recognition motif-containing protein